MLSDEFLAAVDETLRRFNPADFPHLTMVAHLREELTSVNKKLNDFLSGQVSLATALMNGDLEIKQTTTVGDVKRWVELGQAVEAMPINFGLQHVETEKWLYTNARTIATPYTGVYGSAVSPELAIKKFKERECQ
jgi:hypothetical protein